MGLLKNTLILYKKQAGARFPWIGDQDALAKQATPVVAAAFMGQLPETHWFARHLTQIDHPLAPAGTERSSR